jgi:hypothetical protein
MKNKIAFTIIGAVLYCASAAAQQSSPAAVSMPYAGATVSDFKGKVGIQLPAQAFSAPTRGEVLPPDTTVSTDDGRLLLRLSDGSDILVRPHTRLLLKQPETSGWKYFQILIGRVRTSIQKRLGGSPAFQIGTPSAVISVRGTRFEVEVDRRGFTEVDVDEGVVELEALSGRGESVLITAGFSSRVGSEGAPEAPRPIHDVHPQLDRPGRKDNRDSDRDDDGPLKKLSAVDHNRHNDGGNRHGSDSSGSGGHSSGSGGSDNDRGSGSEGGDHHDEGDRHDDSGDHRGSGKPPEWI